MLHESTFHIPDMDCPSEEQLIRSALSEVDGIETLHFDLAKRDVRVWHTCDTTRLVTCLDALGLGSELVQTQHADGASIPTSQQGDQKAVLLFLLAVNGLMFVAESVAGWYGESTGLMSDALDMLADAMVYGIALWAVKNGDQTQKTAVRVSGGVQLLLGLGLIAEVARRAIVGSTPEPPVIIGVASLALVANVVCLLALARHRDGGAHMRASWIFSTNDVIANMGVMAAGGLVHWTGSAWPDLVIGTGIALIVLRGAQRIWRLGRASTQG